MPENCHREKEPTCRYSDDAAEKAVKRVFSILGVDVDEPDQVESFRQDLRFGRSMRKAADKATWAFVAVVGAGMAWAIFEGIISKIKGVIH